ncbi:poly-beta-1,6 N-acetyl-D-glucosamine export porin PgaA [Pseudomonas sp. 5P_3.1_Bac2]|uniref:poly-beta-1,6 N-acetyl-D-glucosamine export porin PgaA n=1 Tax=Pseudomonas sp. 5P_3.1_Bac2 TaxID=2971617 RepID=UPI0039659AEE
MAAAGAVRRFSPGRIGLLCSSLLLTGWAHAQSSYDQLIERARAGDYAPALTYLRQQEVDWHSPHFLTDHLLIASWAGEDAEVVQLYEQPGTANTVNADALAAVARAYRNLRQWPQALNVYRQGLLRFPEHQGLLLGEVMTLADAGQRSAAISRGRSLVTRAPNDPERRLALAYAYLADGQRYAALAEVDKAKDLAPGSVSVAREYLLALQNAGLAQPALTLAERYPHLLDAAQLRSLQGDVLAEQVRQAHLATRSETQRFDLADRALAQAERWWQQWQALPQAQGNIQRLRIDRLGALHARSDMTQVLSEYQQLKAEQVTLPDYALRWVASAYLYLRHPEEAAGLYRQIIAGENDKHPEWLEDQRSLFYALVESGQVEAADAQAAVLATQQAPRTYLVGNPEPEPNPNWLESQELKAASAMQINDTPVAEQSLSQLVANAPNNSSLRTSLASLYLVRGWPRRAEEELKVAESTAPRNLDLEVEQGFAALELQEWQQMDMLADDVISRYPENLQARRLEKLRKVHHMAELRVNGYRGLGSGSQVSGGDDLGIDAVLYSPPIDDNWRVFGGAGYATGDFEEGRGHDRFQRAGVEWRSRNHTVEAEVSKHNFGHGEKPGIRLSGMHDVDDYWQYGWSAQYLSADTPLRALNSDITSDSLSGYVRWRDSERREWRLSANAANFSDGNDRLGLVLTGSERMYTAPDWQADLGLEVGASRNSNDNDVPYFNPKGEYSVLPSVRLQHAIYQRYETLWSQHGEIGAGALNQQNYGTDAIGLISYGQRLRFDDRFDGGLAVSLLSRPYDGDREQEVRVTFDVNYRF